MRRIRVVAGVNTDLKVVLTGRSPLTAEAIWARLPIEGSVSLWGSELYFSTPVHAVEEDSRSVVEAGDVAFWPPGSAFCVFWGETPVSRRGEIRAASPVNVFGRVEGSLEPLRRIKQGDRILLERA